MEDINVVEILIYIINFFVTLMLLYLLLYKPVSKVLSERKERLAKVLSEATVKREEADALLLEAKAELAGTNEKAKQLSHEALDNAMNDAENIIDNAQEKADEMIARAREKMESEWQAALERAYAEIVSFAGGLASHILTREVTVEDNREIVNRFFSELVTQGKSVIEDKSGNKVDVETNVKEEIKS